jgi:cholesterol oxidase
MSAAFDFDYIVIGSGFGGAVMSLRLVEKGYKVCLLERGRHWKMHSFPRRISEINQDLFWDVKNRHYGLMEIRDNEESDVMSVSASGLGGGSLIYANVLIRMPEDHFANWPKPITRKTLDPYYEQVIQTMEASPYPLEQDPYYQDTPKALAFREISKKLEKSDEATAAPQFLLPDLAIRFQGEFPGQQMQNKHGALQSKCTKCGECDIGCNIHAKNTLDLNYIHRAKTNQQYRYPLQVLTDSEVDEVCLIEEDKVESGYQVLFHNPKQGHRSIEQKVLKAKNVVISAGSIGSTELLLKMKKQKKLPKLNSWLGKKWCGNGDLEGTVLNTDQVLEPTKGPVITSAIRYEYSSYPDGFRHSCYIQDAGFPIGMAWYLSGKIPQAKSLFGQFLLGYHYLKNFILRIFGLLKKKSEMNVGKAFEQAIDDGDFIQKAMVLLGMGRDRSDGIVSLNEKNQAVVNWKLTSSQLHYDRVRTEMKKIAGVLGGDFVDNPLTYLQKVIAVHPLGGCPMSETESEGFVNTKGQVYHYPGLYVVDASILPTSIGPNPSLTIAALAEYIADQIPAIRP